ncbi:MAG TPA: VWA domain-containing protein [Gemmatimonadaceae bacterium]|nr:VWA domain-containing protein [Gemmatimonadaceae bacterium]
MSEPEDVILEGAYAATTFVTRLWRRHVPGPPRVELAEVRPRLELFVGAIFGDVPSIVPAEPPALPSFVGRLMRRIPRHLLDSRAHASTDGVRIRLPRALHARAARAGETADRAVAVVAYRLLAVEQAARAARGTPTARASEARALTPDVRDLFQLCEAAAVDRWLARELPGLAGELRAARHDALGARPALSALTARERAVEEWLCALLGAPPDAPPHELPVSTDPRRSLAWARERAAALAALPGRYRGLPTVPLWGRAEPLAPDAPSLRSHGGEDAREPHLPDERVRTLRRRPRIRPSPDDEDDGQMGLWMIQLDEPQEHVEDPMGLQRPADQDAEKDADDLADSLAELPEARLVAAPGTPAEVLASEDPPPRSALQPDAVPQRVGVAYPEWDHRIGAYLPAHAIVRELPASQGDARWVEGVLRRHAREIDQVRRRFERLRPQRVRLGRQLDGSDFDITAYTETHADVRAGCGSDDRLYEAVRPARRDIAVSLLVDISGSTDGWLSEQGRIIDVEKEAVLLVCEALDALGDRYAVSAFSGEGPRSVALYPVKRFHERYGLDTRLRIAGLEHDRYTRMGAALRHATALLCKEPAHHRLLLLLTDGKPNDVDLYEGRYGIEDTRQAVAEARLQGAQPFCLTVDREAPSYLPRLFGPGAYTVLRRASTLPQALVEVVRRLLHG